MTNLTQKALSEAAEALLEERPLDKITIKDITDRCGLTRNTFYYHFQDVHDLLGYILQSRADEILEGHRDGSNWAEVFRELLEYCYEHKRLIEHVYGSVRHDQLEINLAHVVDNYALQIIEIQTEGMDVGRNVRATVADFYKNAFVGATLQWVRGGMKEKPSDMAAVYDEVFRGTVKSAVASAQKAFSEKK